MSLTGAGKTQTEVNTTTIADGDSIASYLVDSLGQFLTSTLVVAAQALDVNVVQSALPAGAALDATLQSILTILTDEESSFGGTYTTGDAGARSLIAVRSDAGGPLEADGKYSPLSLDATGAVRVAGTFMLPGTYAEDSAATSGDIGMFTLAVRRDTTGTQTSANGDYSEFQTWSNGDLKVVDHLNKINLQQIVSVGTSAVALPTAALAFRKSMMIQNLSSAVVYVGSSTVTTTGATRGFQIGKGGYISLDAGPAQAIFGIATAAASDVGVWELS